MDSILSDRESKEIQAGPTTIQWLFYPTLSNRSRVPAWGGVRGMRWTVLLVPLVARPGLERTVLEFLKEIAAVRAIQICTGDLF